MVNFRISKKIDNQAGMFDGELIMENRELTIEDIRKDFEWRRSFAIRLSPFVE